MSYKIDDVCPICGKVFCIPYKGHWIYKKGWKAKDGKASRKYYLCSSSCLKELNERIEKGIINKDNY